MNEHPNQSDLHALAVQAEARATAALAGHISDYCQIQDCSECQAEAHEAVASGLY